MNKAERVWDKSTRYYISPGRCVFIWKQEGWQTVIAEGIREQEIARERWPSVHTVVGTSCGAD